VVVGKSSFLATYIERSNHYSWQLDGAEIHFQLLHLRNESAVNYMDTGRCATRQTQYFLGFRCAMGQYIIWREGNIMERRPKTPLFTRGSRLPWRTSRDWTGRLSRGCAREEYRTAPKAFAIRFDARWDGTSRLKAFDHYYTHRLPPCFSFVFYFAAERKVAGRLDCTPTG
jgi:hypothetical protein